MSISNWSLEHISKVCNNVQYGAPYSGALRVKGRSPTKRFEENPLKKPLVFINNINHDNDNDNNNTNNFIKVSSF